MRRAASHDVALAATASEAGAAEVDDEEEEEEKRDDEDEEASRDAWHSRRVAAAKASHRYCFAVGAVECARKSKMRYSPDGDDGNPWHAMREAIKEVEDEVLTPKPLLDETEACNEGGNQGCRQR